MSFGTANTETLGELVWAFFEYWAWKHDYNTAVVSVRTGGFLTKAQKEWTRRIGNERHLVSIEVCACAQHGAKCFVCGSPLIPTFDACVSSCILHPGSVL